MAYLIAIKQFIYIAHLYIVLRPIPKWTKPIFKALNYVYNQSIDQSVNQ